MCIISLKRKIIQKRTGGISCYSSTKEGKGKDKNKDEKVRKKRKNGGMIENFCFQLIN